MIESRILNLEQAGSSGYLLALECGSLFCHHDISCSTPQSDCRDDTHDTLWQWDWIYPLLELQ